MPLEPRKVNPAFAQAALNRLMSEAGIPDPRTGEHSLLVPAAVPHQRAKLVYSGWTVVPISSEVILPESFDGVIPNGGQRNVKRRDNEYFEAFLFGRIQYSARSPDLIIEAWPIPAITPDSAEKDLRDENEGNAIRLFNAGNNSIVTWFDFPLPLLPWKMRLVNTSGSGTNNRVALTMVYHNLPMAYRMLRGTNPAVPTV